MVIRLTREQLLRPLQQVIGVVERRQTLPILSTILFRQENSKLHLTGTDMELELMSSIAIEQLGDHQFTVPGRKLMDICRTLPEHAEIEISNNKQEVIVKSARSKFKLLSLNPEDFPAIEEEVPLLECAISAKQLDYLLQHTLYAMAQQDVRFYLNGMLFDFSGKQLNTVAIDGHRMAYSEQTVTDAELVATKIILPRKGVSELSRLLSELDESLVIKITKNHFQICTESVQLTSKLIDGKYPDYRLVMPKQCDNTMISNKKLLQQALARAAILSNEKFKGISFELSENKLTLIATNAEQELAEETVEVDYNGQDTAIGFNGGYLQDALSAINGDKVRFSFSAAGGSVLIEDLQDENSFHVIMPMRL